MKSKIVNHYSVALQVVWGFFFTSDTEGTTGQ